MDNLRINYLAVIVAAFAAFIASSVWYALLGSQLAKVSPVFAVLRTEKPRVWRVISVFIGSLVLSFVLAYVISLKENVTVVNAIEIGCLLWFGLCATQWLSSMVWEKVPLKMAAIHGGDWLVKLIIISAVVAWLRK